ncbi:hypothetical protein BBJ28_00026107 [Nothophytophthora sp. Chile5]|nr:hypothetical protein BBJ28_00026107 [Nothophytophthora sp. Chile5]
MAKRLDEVGSEKGRQLLQDLNIRVEPVPTVVSAVENATLVNAFDWESVVDGNGREIALFEGQRRTQYREYMERNIGAVLAEKKLCVLDVENIPDLLTVQVPGLNIDLAGRTDLLILSDVAKKYPSELPSLPGVKMLIEVKKEIVTDSSYQALSELIALDLRSDDPVMALLTNLTDNWQFFCVSSEKSGDCATINKATIKKPGEAFRVIKALLAQPPTADEVNLPYIQGPVKRRKLAQLLPCIDEGGESGGNRECIERYFDIASVLGPDVEMARAVGRQIARSIPAFSMYS